MQSSWPPCESLAAEAPVALVSFDLRQRAAAAEMPDAGIGRRPAANSAYLRGIRPAHWDPRPMRGRRPGTYGGGMGTAVAVEAPAQPRLRRSLLDDGRIVGTAIVGLITLYVIADIGHLYDDPFILHGYADNLISGHGWTFDPGTTSANAATSTGHVLLLAALGLVGFTMPAASTVLFAAGLGAAAWFTFLTHRGRGGATAAVLVLLSPTIVNVRGMESAVMLGLLAAAVWAAREHHETSAALLLVALTVMRPDGVLLAAVLVGWRRVVDGRWPVRMVMVGMTAGVTAGAAILAAVGVPATLQAKVAQGATDLTTSFVDYSGRVVSEAKLWWVIVAVGAALNRRWLWQPSVWFAVAFVAAYAALGVAGYPWYYVVPAYAAAVAAGAGLERHPRLPPAALLVAALAIGSMSSGLPHARRSLMPAAQWIEQNTASDATVAPIEIGIVGWHTTRQVVDPMGLLTPDQSIIALGADEWLRRTQPDYLVMNLSGRAEAAMRQAADASYRPVSQHGPVTVWERTARG